MHCMFSMYFKQATSLSLTDRALAVHTKVTKVSIDHRNDLESSFRVIRMSRCDMAHMISCHHSIVTLALSCIVSHISLS